MPDAPDSDPAYSAITKLSIRKCTPCAAELDFTSRSRLRRSKFLQETQRPGHVTTAQFSASQGAARKTLHLRCEGEFDSSGIPFFSNLQSRLRTKRQGHVLVVHLPVLICLDSAFRTLVSAAGAARRENWNGLFGEPASEGKAWSKYAPTDLVSSQGQS